MIPTNLARSMRLIGVATTVLALALASVPSVAQSQIVRSGEESARILAIEKLAVQESMVSGEVRNKSNHPVRDVQLFIRYTWLWDDERNPGRNDPGTSTYYTLKETIQPKSTINFVYKPSPALPKSSGGRFDTSVTIAGFTEIIPQP